MQSTIANNNIFLNTIRMNEVEEVHRSRYQVLFVEQLSKNLTRANLTSNIVLFSVFFERTFDFEDCLFNKSHKFTHVERVVPELRMITVLRVKLLKKRVKVQSHKEYPSP